MRVHDEWLLTPERAAVHLPTATAVLADLHFGYDLARRRAGEAVPRFCLREALAPLRSCRDRAGVRRLVVAGDLFEEQADPALAAELSERLGELGVEFAGLVPGNHDRGAERAGGRWPVFPGGLELGGWRVVHGDRRLPAGRVVHGHLHPSLRWGRVTAPCFLVSEQRIVLPAYSLDAHGVSVLSRRAWRRYRCCVVAGSEVLDLGKLERLQKTGSG
jgi:metallophosphoesterase superfamily enzyme